MSITLSALQKQRTDTAANWTAANPTLLSGELGFESDTGKAKLGTGSTAWNSLGYLGLIPSSGVYPLTQLLLPYGTAVTPSLSFAGDTNTGISSPSADQLVISTNGTARLTTSTTGITSALPINSPLGTASAPSYTFTGDLNTGIYSPGADQVAISTNGTQRLLIEADGDINIDSGGVFYDAINNRLGVGITSPAAKLEIRDNTQANLSWGDTAAIGSLTFDGSSQPVVRALSGKSLVFQTNGANERLRITSTGALNFVGAGTAGSTQAVSFNGSAPINSLVIDSTGKVGLGSSTPQAELNVAKTGSAATVYIESDAGNNSTTSILRFGGASGRSASIQGFRGASSSIHSLDFYTYNGADAFGMRLTPTGLGIGTTSPVSIFDVTVGGSGTRKFLVNYDDSLITIKGSNQLSNPETLRLVGDDIRFNTGTSGSGTERARIDSSGRLLVGTSSWSAASTAVFEGASDNSAGKGILHIARGNTAANLVSGAAIGSMVFSDSAGGAFAEIAAAADATPGASDYPGRLVFSTTADGASSPTERVRIDSSGRVGIGTASPNEKLDVRGKLYLNNGSASYFDAGSSNGLVITNPTAVRWEVNSFERARIDSSGRLLVGTSSTLADAKAVFQGSSGGDYCNVFFARNASNPTSNSTLGNLRFADSNQNIGAQIVGLTDANWSAGSYGGRLVFSTTRNGASSPTEAVRINNGGAVLSFCSSNEDGHYISSGATAGTTRSLILGRYSATGVTDGTVSFRVWSNGDVQNTNNSYGAISDIKLKENIVDANSQWDDLKALQVRNYNFKEGQTHTQIGLVAQEVELVSPGLVSESPDRDEDGNDLGTVTKSVNYSVLYMKAVKALQEAMERIEVLEAKVNALEGN